MPDWPRPFTVVRRSRLSSAFAPVCRTSFRLPGLNRRFGNFIQRFRVYRESGLHSAVSCRESENSALLPRNSTPGHCRFLRPSRHARIPKGSEIMLLYMSRPGVISSRRTFNILQDCNLFVNPFFSVCDENFLIFCGDFTKSSQVLES